MCASSHGATVDRTSFAVETPRVLFSLIGLLYVSLHKKDPTSPSRLVRRQRPDAVLALQLDKGDFGTEFGGRQRPIVVLTPRLGVFELICLPVRPEHAKIGVTFGGGGEASAARELVRQEEAGAWRQRPARVLAAQPGHGNDTTSYLSLGHVDSESSVAKTSPPRAASPRPLRRRDNGLQPAGCRHQVVWHPCRCCPRPDPCPSPRLGSTSTPSRGTRAVYCHDVWPPGPPATRPPATTAPTRSPAWPTPPPAPPSATAPPQSPASALPPPAPSPASAPSPAPLPRPQRQGPRHRPLQARQGFPASPAPPCTPTWHQARPQPPAPRPRLRRQARHQPPGRDHRHPAQPARPGGGREGRGR